MVLILLVLMILLFAGGAVAFSPLLWLVVLAVIVLALANRSRF